LQKIFDAEFGINPGDGIICAAPEEVHTGEEQQRVENAGQKDPGPEPVFPQKVVGFAVRLKRYDYFFEQIIFRWVNIGIGYKF
jgi:hypothetical protein